MSTITIQDLDLSKTLDRQAMAQLSGGYTYTGSSTLGVTQLLTDRVQKRL